MRRSESFSTAPYENGYRFLLTNVFPSHQPVKKREFSAQTYGSDKFHSYFQQASPHHSRLRTKTCCRGKKEESAEENEKREGGRKKWGEKGGSKFSLECKLTLSIFFWRRGRVRPPSFFDVGQRSLSSADRVEEEVETGGKKVPFQSPPDGSDFFLPLPPPSQRLLEIGTFFRRGARNGHFFC